MTTRIVQVGLAVRDLQRATDFYADLLGMAPVARFEPPGLVFFDLDGVRLLLSGAGGSVAEPSSTFVYLEVSAIGSVVDRLRDQGVTIESGPQVVFAHTDGTLGPQGSSEWQAFIRDTEGNLVCLVEQVRGPTLRDDTDETDESDESDENQRQEDHA